MQLKDKEILIIPKSKGNIKKINFSRNLQTVLIMLAVVLGLTTGYIGFDYLALRSQMSDYLKIIEENHVLRGENEKLSTNLVKIVQRFEKVKIFQEEVATLLGINNEDPNSKGGYDSNTLYNEYNRNERLNKIREEIISGLKTELYDKEDSFIRIKDFIYKNNSLIAATPSLWPCKGYITSGFAPRLNPMTGRVEFHQGIDIAGPLGTGIVATADGIITRCENNPFGYGKLIEIKHGFGYSSRYAHMNSLLVKTGQVVKRGQVIGTRGNTGRSTGPHLHYEVRLNNKCVNPINFILEYNLE